MAVPIRSQLSRTGSLTARFVRDTPVSRIDRRQFPAGAGALSCFDNDKTGSAHMNPARRDDGYWGDIRDRARIMDFQSALLPWRVTIFDSHSKSFLALAAGLHVASRGRSASI